MQCTKKNLTTSDIVKQHFLLYKPDRKFSKLNLKHSNSQPTDNRQVINRLKEKKSSKELEFDAVTMQKAEHAWHLPSFKEALKMIDDLKKKSQSSTDSAEASTIG